jgi:acetylornithine deacetylase/succinyl-diaminopimelate desuccinylase-like protein
MKNGILLIGHLDVPVAPDIPFQAFRRTPDRLYGEGIGCSRGPLVMMEFAMGALRSLRQLRKLPLGVLFYTDEGQDARYSRDIIRAASEEAKQVLFLRPGISQHCAVIQRRGQMKFRLVVEGEPHRLGQRGKRLETARWTCNKIEQMIAISSRKQHVAVGLTDINIQSFPMRLPHMCRAELLLSYLDKTRAHQAEEEMRGLLGKEGYEWTLEKISDRPPLKEREKSRKIFLELAATAEKWEIPFEKKSSLWPSAAGLVPAGTGVVCGLGPVAQDLYTPNESIKRINLLQRTLLLAHFLLKKSLK